MPELGHLYPCRWCQRRRHKPGHTCIHLRCPEKNTIRAASESACAKVGSARAEPGKTRSYALAGAQAVSPNLLSASIAPYRGPYSASFTSKRGAEIAEVARLPNRPSANVAQYRT